MNKERSWGNCRTIRLMDRIGDVGNSIIEDQCSIYIVTRRVFVHCLQNNRHIMHLRFVLKRKRGLKGKIVFDLKIDRLIHSIDHQGVQGVLSMRVVREEDMLLSNRRVKQRMQSEPHLKSARFNSSNGPHIQRVNIKIIRCIRNGIESDSIASIANQSLHSKKGFIRKYQLSVRCQIQISKWVSRKFQPLSNHSQIVDGEGEEGFSRLWGVRIESEKC